MFPRTSLQMFRLSSYKFAEKSMWTFVQNTITDVGNTHFWVVLMQLKAPHTTNTAHVTHATIIIWGSITTSPDLLIFLLILLNGTFVGYWTIRWMQRKPFLNGFLPHISPLAQFSYTFLKNLSKIFLKCLQIFLSRSLSHICPIHPPFLTTNKRALCNLVIHHENDIGVFAEISV